jgi:hypothetical protein
MCPQATKWVGLLATEPGIFGRVLKQIAQRVAKKEVSPATLMGPPFRQCEGTTSGVCSVGMSMMTAGA